MGEWKECKLNDVAEVISGFAFKSKDFRETGIPVIKIKNITPSGVSFEDCDHISMNREELEKLAKYRLAKGDYLVAMTGATIGKVGRIKIEAEALLNQRVAKIKALDGIADSDFIWYCVSQSDFQEHIVNAASGSSVQENASAEDIGQYEIQVPPLPEQRAIAEVLSSLDDKIDLLHRQNQTLETLAETLFRQWFVEPLGGARGKEADEGWEECRLFDAIEIVGGGTPKTEVAEYWDGDIPWISAKDITPNHKGFIIDTDKQITSLGLEQSAAKVLPKLSTLISARGTVGKYCLLGADMTFSQSNYGIMPKFKNCQFFTYLLIAESVEELKAASYGTVFDTITTNTFKEHMIRIPAEREILAFEETVRPYFQRMLTNSHEIRTLTQLRDTLLPKLMSGEIRLNQDLQD